MSLFFQLFPLYLLGNFHCIGMCGPLVMLLGSHRYKYFYFFGRTLSFSFVGLLAGEMGAVLNLFLHDFYISSVLSLFFGCFICFIGVTNLLGKSYISQDWLASRFANFNKKLSLLMLQDKALPSFLFGFFTVMLPCGQSLIVFSACAIYGEAFAGLFNGFVFAVLTSPSLIVAMHSFSFFKSLRKYYNPIMGGCALLVGCLALCRGLADLNLINHLTIQATSYHLVVY